MMIKERIVYFLSCINKKIMNKMFLGSELYWEERYKHGGTSGAGSYNQLAVFKSSVINNFVKEKSIETIIEFGCGDGNQLSYANYPKYIGLDVSTTALVFCIKRFIDDKTKSFFLYKSDSYIDNSNVFRAQLTLSLDVVYHLIEDDIYHKYIYDLFNTSEKYVIIYSSNTDTKKKHHERDRFFTKYVNENIQDFTLIKVVKNIYKFDLNDTNNTSKADFYIYQRCIGATTK